MVRHLPVLTATTIALAALAPFWPPAFMALLGVLLLNVAVRYASDEHVNAIGQSFRQCAPLIAACESLRFLEGDDIDPLVAPLRTEVASLARLKLISRCTNGDPLMLSVSTQPVAIALFSDLVRAVYEYLNLALVLDGTGVYLGVRDLAARRTRAGSRRGGGGRRRCRNWRGLVPRDAWCLDPT